MSSIFSSTGSFEVAQEGKHLGHRHARPCGRRTGAAIRNPGWVAISRTSSAPV